MPTHAVHRARSATPFATSGTRWQALAAALFALLLAACGGGGDGGTPSPAPATPIVVTPPPPPPPAQPAPTITSFTVTPATLPVGGGSVTLSWATADATSLAVDKGVGTVTGTSQVVTVATDTTFTLTATNATGTASKAAAVTVATGLVRYIDVATGADTNPCTQAAPCKSMTKAFVGAPAGTTFMLGDGTYTPLTEGANFFNIPDGATLQAAHPGAATVATLAVQALGSATLNGLVIDRQSAAFNCGGIDASSATGTPTLTLIGVFSNCTNWLHVGGKVKATMTPGVLPGGAYTTGLPANGGGWANVNSTVAAGGSAELLIQGGVIEGSNTGLASGTVVTVGGNARLTLDGVTVRNWKSAAISGSGGTITLRNGTLIDHAGAALTAPSARCGAVVLGLYYVGTQASALTVDHSTISNAAGHAICVQNNLIGGVFDQVTLTQSTITASAGAAIASEFAQGFGAVVVLDGMTLTNNGYGIFWAGRTGGSFDVRNTTVTGSSAAGGIGAGIYVYATPAASFKLRASTVSGGAQDGVTFGGFVTMTVDLGTAADPGGNTFTGNAASGLLNGMAPGQTLNAVGNTWTPNVQGADANGRYSTPPAFAPVPKVGPANGVNYHTENASTLNL